MILAVNIVTLSAPVSYCALLHLISEHEIHIWSQSQILGYLHEAIRKKVSFPVAKPKNIGSVAMDFFILKIKMGIVKKIGSIRDIFL